MGPKIKANFTFLFRVGKAVTVEQLLFLLASSGKNEYIQDMIFIIFLINGELLLVIPGKRVIQNISGPHQEKVSTSELILRRTRTFLECVQSHEQVDLRRVG